MITPTRNPESERAFVEIHFQLFDLFFFLIPFAIFLNICRSCRIFFSRQSSTNTREILGIRYIHIVYLLSNSLRLFIFFFFFFFFCFSFSLCYSPFFPHHHSSSVSSPLSSYNFPRTIRYIAIRHTYRFVTTHARLLYSLIPFHSLFVIRHLDSRYSDPLADHSVESVYLERM